MKKLGKTMLSISLSLMMVVGVMPNDIFAATKTSGTNLRLEAIEGSVKLSNSQGKELKAKSDIKLYNGYMVSTSASGYAWLSIDKDVVVKLDKSTKAGIKQNGKKLEVQLESGKLFFDVKKPIEVNSSLNIRTSNTTTGIRGTVGIVESNLYTTLESDEMEAVTITTILEGAVEQEMMTLSASGINQNQVQIKAMMQSKVATSFLKSDVKEGVILNGETRTSLIPISVKNEIMNNGFVAVAIRDNKELADKISKVEGSDLTKEAVKEISKEADRLIKEEEKKETERVEKIVKEVDRIIEEIKKSEGVKELEKPSGGSEGGGSWQPPKLSNKITFNYNEDIVATQKVKFGEKLMKPTLQPTEVGSWKILSNGQWINYNFDLVVNDEFMLYWK